MLVAFSTSPPGSKINTNPPPLPKGNVTAWSNCIVAAPVVLLVVLVTKVPIGIIVPNSLELITIPANKPSPAVLTMFIAIGEPAE